MADNFISKIGGAIFGRSESDDAAPLEIAKASSDFSVLGTTGIVQVGGYITSTDRIPQLNGFARWDEYRRMLVNTSIIAAGVNLFLDLITNAQWTVNPAEGQEDNQSAIDIADLAYDIIFDMKTPWHNVVRKQAMFKFYGFTIQEKTAKMRDDGNVGLYDISIRPQRTITRWNIDPKGEVLGVFQTTPISATEIPIPRHKIVYSVDDTLTESPDGFGLFRMMHRGSCQLTAYEGLEEVGFENDLSGIPVTKGPLESIKANADAMPKEDGLTYIMRMTKPLTDFINFRQKKKTGGLMLDSATYRGLDDAQTPSAVPKWSVELLQGNSSGFAAIGAAINRKNMEMARILGVEHLLLGADGGGSLALGRTKTESFYLRIVGVLSDLVEIFERDIIDWLADLNGWPDELIPSLAVEEISAPDIIELTGALLNMAQAGAVLAPDDPAIGEVRDMLGFTRPSKESVAMDMMLRENANTTAPTIEPKPSGTPVQKWITTSRSKARQRRADMKKRAA